VTETSLEILRTLVGETYPKASVFLIGSYAYGGYSPSRSDIDLLVYEDRADVLYEEDVVFKRLRGIFSGGFAVCHRPLGEWQDPLRDLRREEPLTWKEFSSVEDVLMARTHGISLAGFDLNEMASNIDQSSARGYFGLRYEVLNMLTAEDPMNAEQEPGGTEPARYFSRAVARTAREACFVWMGLMPSRLELLPHLFDQTNPPAGVLGLVAQAATSLLSNSDSWMLTRVEAERVLEWANSREIYNGERPWASMASAPAKVKRRIVDLRSIAFGL